MPSFLKGPHSPFRLLLSFLVLGALAACGQATTQGPAASNSASASDSGGVAPAAGDIPDNQVYLTFTGSSFTLKYPEGWVQKTSGDGVTFQDKDSRISVIIRSGPAPSTASVHSNVKTISGASITNDAHTVNLPGGAAVVATYQLNGAADPVTGKQPRLTVDHYEIAGTANRIAVLELANRLGDDNVDAYRLIAESFRWR